MSRFFGVIVLAFVFVFLAVPVSLQAQHRGGFHGGPTATFNARPPVAQPGPAFVGRPVAICQLSRNAIYRRYRDAICGPPGDAARHHHTITIYLLFTSRFQTTSGILCAGPRLWLWLLFSVYLPRADRW